MSAVLKQSCHISLLSFFSPRRLKADILFLHILGLFFFFLGFIELGYILT